MKKIIRVFPKQNSYTPIDEYAFYGMPTPLFQLPEHDEIHISCTFTWDKAECENLAYQWETVTNKPVKIGGVAYKNQALDFQQGMYIKSNIIFTSRGCNNNCKWCIVPSIEGKLKELPIVQGNIIQDNNFLQCSKSHKEKVFEMLKTQKTIMFKGGLETDLIDEHFIDLLSRLNPRHIAELWLACDTDGRINDFIKAVEKLKKLGFTRDKIKCYVLSYGKDLKKDEERAKTVYEVGAMPFVQLYRDFSDIKTNYGEIEKWAREWQRPAIIESKFKNTKS